MGADGRYMAALRRLVGHCGRCESRGLVLGRYVPGEGQWWMPCPVCKAARELLGMAVEPTLVPERATC